jgi:precorrin-6B methylase 2
VIIFQVIMIPNILLGLVLLTAITAALTIVIYSLRVGITPMPSSRKARNAILRLLRQDTVPATVYELGAGWGTLAVAIAKSLPGARVVAIELSPIPFLFAKVYAALRDCRNVTLVRKDFLRTDISDADAVVCYLYRGAMIKLGPKLQSQLRPGARVISNTFSLPGWKRSG